MTLRTHTPTHTHLLQAIRVDSRSSFILQQLLVPIVSQKLDDSLDLLRSRARRHKESIRRSEEHTSELQSQFHLVCRLLLEKKKKLHSDHTVFPNNMNGILY